MLCECEYPIPPLSIVRRQGFLSEKEIPNYEDYTCKMYGRKYKLKSYKGEMSIIDKNNTLPKKPNNIPVPKHSKPKSAFTGFTCQHVFKYLKTNRNGTDIFYCEKCLEYKYKECK